MVKVVGMFPNKFTNRGGAANEINGKDFKRRKFTKSNQKGETK